MTLEKVSPDLTYRRTPRRNVPPGSSRGEALIWHGWDVTPSGCWEYRGARGTNGYGEVYHAGKSFRAHRVAYEHFKGRIPRGLVVRHTCDNKPCVNPVHLLVGTAAQNTADARERGLLPRGERNGVAKLTEAQVVRIKTALRAGRGPTELGREFGVSDSAIYYIQIGKNWAHVE